MVQGEKHLWDIHDWRGQKNQAGHGDHTNNISADIPSIVTLIVSLNTHQYAMMYPKPESFLHFIRNTVNLTESVTTHFISYFTRHPQNTRKREFLTIIKSRVHIQTHRHRHTHTHTYTHTRARIQTRVWKYGPINGYITRKYNIVLLS